MSWSISYAENNIKYKIKLQGMLMFIYDILQYENEYFGSMLKGLDKILKEK